MSKSCRNPLFAATLGLLAAATTVPGRADPVADFYKGKTITVIVATDAGNSYDLYTRTIARHMPRYIPGNPSMIVQNMPGAGGIVAANHLTNVASKDGLTLGQVQNTVPLEPFYGNQRAQFDANKMNWLGSPGKETAALIVWHTVPVETLEEAQSRGLVLGATGVNSTPAFYARVISAVFGAPIKLVAGYKSQNEAFLAMERGENEGYSSTFISSLKLTHPEWIANKTVKLLLQYGAERSPGFESVPFADEIITKEDDRALMRIAVAPLALGRPLLAPPGVPEDRVAALRQALEQTFRDKDYLADCAQQRFECDRPSTGAALADIVKSSYAAPDAIRTRLQAIYSATQ